MITAKEDEIAELKQQIEDLRAEMVRGRGTGRHTPAYVRPLSRMERPPARETAPTGDIEGTSPHRRPRGDIWPQLEPLQTQEVAVVILWKMVLLPDYYQKPLLQFQDLQRVHQTADGDKGRLPKSSSSPEKTHQFYWMTGYPA